MERLLGQLVEKLRKAHGEDLVCVLLYGSSAAPGARDGDFSDLNVLCVLKEIAPRQLAQSHPVFTWWRQYEKAAPLLLSEREVDTSADCFAIEFHDMRSRRRVLYGRDVIEGLKIGNGSYRAQVEYELRSKLVRLRQKAAGMLSDRKLLTRLLLDSVTTFLILTRHALLLHGVDAPHDRRAVLKLAQERFGIDPQCFTTLLDAREKKIKTGQIQPEPLLGEYLKQIGTIVDAVDRLETIAAGSGGEA
jgi:hypothetical protein